MPAGQPVCGECLRDPPPFERTIAALDYGAPWSALIARFKFQGGVELAPVLSGLLREAVRGQPPPELLLPAPLSDARLRERGFNQSWEIARRLGPPADCLLLPVALLPFSRFFGLLNGLTSFNVMTHALNVSFGLQS